MGITRNTFSPINSLQRGSKDITLSGGAGTGTETITAVDTTKSLVWSETSGPGAVCSVELTNSTTLTFAISSDSATPTLAIKWQVVEYK